MLIVAVAVMLLAACVPQGSVLIQEKEQGAAFDVTFQDWSKQEKFTMQLAGGDEVRIAVQCTKGSLALTVTGEDGSQPYVGNTLTELAFTLTVEKTGAYTFAMAGSSATGTLTAAK